MIKLVNTHGDEWVFDDEQISFTTHEKLDQAIEYWRNGKHDIAEKKIKKIISENAYHIDALHHLSIIYADCSMELEAYLCCREAARIGLSVIPESFSWKSSKLTWGHIDNRPFLRAYHNLGLWLKKRNEINNSIEVFENILSVCPNDNLGVRYILPELWLDKGDAFSAIRHCKNHQDDHSPEIMYTYSLALILSGEIRKAEDLLAEAKIQFPLVAKELKKKRHQKPKQYGYDSITVGGPDQAYEYWKHYGKHWSGSAQAMELISRI